MAILSEIFSSVEIYSEIKLNFVEIQISKRKSIKNFPLITLFLLLSLHEMAISDFENQKFPGMACPRTPLACAGFRA